MHTRRQLAGLIMLAGMGGCRTSCDSPSRVLTDLHVDEAAIKLNRSPRGIVPGGVYVLDSDAPRLVLDLGAQLAKSEMRTWYMREHLAGSYRYVVGAASIGAVCSPDVYVGRGAVGVGSVDQIPLIMVSTSIIIARVLDALFFLEVLNRSLTGAQYNRVSEQKIAGWRASLADVLFRTRLQGTSQVALCLAVETAQDGVVDLTQRIPVDAQADVIDRLGRQSALEFAAGHRAETLGEGVQSSPQVAVLRRPATISAIFQELTLVNPSIEPRIEFGLGYPHRISVPLEST